jgi:O-antigen/teichoic acid export membrane protein
MKSMARTSLGLAALVMTRVVGAASALGVSLIMARHMALEEMGVAVTAMALAPIGAVLASGGLEGGSVRYLAGYLATDNQAEARGFLRFSFAGVLVLSFVAMSLGAAAILGGARAGEAAPLLLAVCASGFLAIARVLASHAQGFGEPLRATVTLQLARPLALMVGLGVLAAVAAPFGATGAVAIFLAAAVLAAGMQARLSRPLHRKLGPGLSDRRAWRSWISTGFQLGVAAIYIEFGRELAILFSGLVLEPADVARLGVAIRIIGLVKFGQAAINVTFLPRLNGALARGDTATASEILSFTNHLKFWPLVLIMPALMYFGTDILSVFGPDFTVAAPLLGILMLEPIFAAIFGPGSTALAFSPAVRFILPVSAAATALLFAAVWVGGATHGLQGAAWGIVLAWGVWSAAIAALARLGAGIDVTFIGSIRRAVHGETRASS